MAIVIERDTPEDSTKRLQHAAGSADDISITTSTDLHNADDKDALLYHIDDAPPWYMGLLLGFQNNLTMFGATIAMPLVYTPALCVGDDNVAKAEIMSTVFFVSGMVTIVQSTVGIRLPIVQGGTFGFVAPIFALMALPQWQCPESPCEESTLLPSNNTNCTDWTDEEKTEIWQQRMREVQGAIIVSSLFQVLIGGCGLLGFILQYFGPLSIAPVVTLMGLSLFEVASDFCQDHWWIAVMTMVLLLLCSQYLPGLRVPVAAYNRRKKCHVSWLPVFKLFPVIIAVLISWGICWILTLTDVLPDDPTQWGYHARTDTKQGVIKDAKWFRLPYPGQWGTPTVSVAGVFGMLAGVLAGLLESLGDYFAAARISGAPPPPMHAVNRGIFIEGVGCVAAGLWGTGTGTTSYSENIGAIGITKVASRRVVQFSGLLLLIYGMLGKFGALFVTIPDPVIGGVFMVMLGMVTAVGVSNLQYVNMNSSRNLCIFGFSLFFGLSLPNWMAKNTESIDTGSTIFDQLATVLLSTSMLVGGTVGFILDNTIPGTAEERGMVQWTAHLNDTTASDDSPEAPPAPLAHSITDSNATGASGPPITTITTTTTASCYDFPIGMSVVRRVKAFSYIPISPTFNGWSNRRRNVERPEKSALPDDEAETSV